MRHCADRTCSVLTVWTFMVAYVRMTADLSATISSQNIWQSLYDEWACDYVQVDQKITCTSVANKARSFSVRPRPPTSPSPVLALHAALST